MLPLIVITVARKPLSEGSVTKNALRWGTGGLNIQAIRLPTRENLDGGAYTEGREPRAMAPGGFGQRQVSDCGEYEHPGGRWPANLVLQHKAECRRVGFQKVSKGGDCGPASTKQARADEMLYLGGAPGGFSVSHYDPDGTETVDAWECAPGCPVTNINEQSGASRFFKQTQAED